MPELPEVDFTSWLVGQHIIGKQVRQVIATETGGGPRDGEFDAKVMDPATVPDALTLVRALERMTCVSVNRVGKQMFAQFAKAPPAGAPAKALAPCTALLLHLGMTGSLTVKGVANVAYKSFRHDQSQWPPRFTKLELVMADDTRVAFVDTRRLGLVRLKSCEQLFTTPPLSKLACDPRDAMPSKEAFFSKIKKYNSPVKAVLLDQQKVVCGIGNWMVDEVCFQARLHPEVRCNELSREASDEVHDKIKYVVDTACTLLRDGKEYPSDWLFHHRWGKGSKKDKNGPKVQGHGISFLTVGGRTTVFVPDLQLKTWAKSSGGGELDAAGSDAGESEADVKFELEPPPPKTKATRKPAAKANAKPAAEKKGSTTISEPLAASTTGNSDAAAGVVAPAKAKRGRPRKATASPGAAAESPATKAKRPRTKVSGAAEPAQGLRRSSRLTE